MLDIFQKKDKGSQIFILDMSIETNYQINKYETHERIGFGNFGCVYKGSHKKTREPVAIKIESSRSPVKLLRNETTILNYLSNHGCKNVPSVFWYGLYMDNLCLVMTLYDCSLFDYIQKKKLTENQIHSIMKKCIDIIEIIHNNFVLHRDIKPQNIMIKEGDLFLIDFGFSSFYIGDDGNHIPYNDTLQNIIGSPKYISYNIHNGIEYSRRDDLISLGYLWIFLLCGELPWDNLRKTDNKEGYCETSIFHEKNIQRKSMKSLENISSLFLESFPSVVNYMKYGYLLDYDTQPNYEAVKQLFIEKTI